MKRLLMILIGFPMAAYAQFGTFQQYFDGNDTLPSQSIIITIDNPNQSAWQIGPPNKTYFNSASTVPNVIVTDTSASYPSSDSSSFSFGVTDSISPFGGFGVIAFNWKQQLDFESAVDGGIVEYSTDSGNTWTNAFTSSYVYNYFGYLAANKDTISSNEIAFTGTDTTWRDIWLCFDGWWLSQQDSLRFRYRIHTDSVQSNQDGWMIDNMSMRPTLIHTINEKERSEYIRLNPNPATDYTTIDLKKQKDLHYIKLVRLFDMQGRDVGQWSKVPNKFKVPLEGLETGSYLLSIETNLKTEIHQIVVSD